MVISKKFILLSSLLLGLLQSNIYAVTITNETQNKITIVSPRFNGRIEAGDSITDLSLEIKPGKMWKQDNIQSLQIEYGTKQKHYKYYDDLDVIQEIVFDDVMATDQKLYYGYYNPAILIFTYSFAQKSLWSIGNGRLLDVEPGLPIKEIVEKKYEIQSSAKQDNASWFSAPVKTQEIAKLEVAVRPPIATKKSTKKCHYYDNNEYSIGSKIAAHCMFGLCLAGGAYLLTNGLLKLAGISPTFNQGLELYKSQIPSILRLFPR